MKGEEGRGGADFFLLGEKTPGVTKRVEPQFRGV